MIAFTRTPDDIKVISPITQPFHNIALALSGGGFRAAAFSLGTLSYLHQVQYDEKEQTTLLDKVGFISSTSGGTITAACYLVSQRRGTDFRVFYQRLVDNLTGDKLLQKALQCLSDDSLWSAQSGQKARNFINAFALAYDESLFDHSTMKDLMEVREGFCGFSFNATEFTTGISFRFQHDNYEGVKRGLPGNANIHFNTKSGAYSYLKLGDILAASSCFPAGFEPIVFPNDFRYNGLDAAAYDYALVVKKQGKFIDAPKGMQMALMDGGIDDNQGLYSAMLADDRRSGEDKFDLILASDVTSFYMDPYQPVELKPANGWRAKTIGDYLTKCAVIGRMLSWLLPTALLLFFLTVAVSVSLYPSFSSLVLSFFSGIFLIAFITLALVNRTIKKSHILKNLFGEKTNATIRTALEQIGATKCFSDKAVDQLSTVLSNTSVASIEMMLNERIKSLLVLSMDVNLKQTRRLIYNKFYESPLWDLRRVYCAIFELSTHNQDERKYRIENKQDWKPTQEQQAILLNGCEKMELVAERASNMGTTLWFSEAETKNGMLQDIIACGQFTCCTSLLKYVYSLKQSIKNKLLVLDSAEVERLNRIEEQLLKDWQAFKLDPLVKLI